MTLLHMESKKIQVNVCNKEKYNHRYRKQISGYWVGRGKQGRGQDRQGIMRYSYLPYKQNKHKGTFTAQGIKPLSYNKI